jgi:hypothetical protein
MMTLPVRMLSLVLWIVTLSLADDSTISISKYWSGVVTEGREGRIACRASGQITWFGWRKEGDTRRKEFGSEMVFDRRDNIVVRIGRYSGDEEDNMRFLTILETETVHAGEWRCHVHGDCQDMEMMMMESDSL